MRARTDAAWDAQAIADAVADLSPERRRELAAQLTRPWPASPGRPALPPHEHER
jgi:hypothetical protein